MEQIKNTFTGEIMCGGMSLKAVLEKHTNWLRGDKQGERANLSGANLSRANLFRANLSGANLADANLARANLFRANLSGANLLRADLAGANLSGANLSGADLSRANLFRADLSGANLSDADLADANLRIFKHDIWAVLIYAPSEVGDLIVAIKSGEIDGSCYEGECSCLCGTLEKYLTSQIPIRDASSPAEQWFSMIRPGDTPETNQASKYALEWIEEWQGLIRIGLD